MPNTVVLGGEEYVVGGWGEYEINRRNIEYQITSEPVGPKYYGGLKYVYKDNIVKSLMSAKRLQSTSVLQKSAEHLEYALGMLEDKLCDPDENGVWECAGIVGDSKRTSAQDGNDILTIPSLTSDDMREFINNIDQEYDLEYLYDLSDTIVNIAELMNITLPIIPSLPVVDTSASEDTENPADINDNVAILNMELSSTDRIGNIEQIQIILASNIDQVANKIYANLGYGRPPYESHYEFPDTVGGARAPPKPARKKSISKAEPAPKPARSTPAKSDSKTRGMEIDIASATPPLALLKTRLKWPLVGWYASPFDIIYDVPVISVFHDSIYYGIMYNDNPSRTTILTPNYLKFIAKTTSGRAYSWVIIDSYEACYAIKMSPINGRIVHINPGDIIKWIKENIVGNPPHKMKMELYLTYLRSLGFEIYLDSIKDNEIRFELPDLDTPESRTDIINKLIKMNESDFMKLDWSEYDENVGSQACEQPNELGGDVTIEGNTVRVPKVRTGLAYSTNPHIRSYITFHTHPSARYNGSSIEQPSDGDLYSTLFDCAYRNLVWHFISAPEGTYIIRPTQILIEMYLNDYQYTKDKLWEIYLSYIHSCDGNVKQNIIQIIMGLRDAGFVAYFRDKPCVPLLDKPDYNPAWNNINRQEYRNRYQESINIKPDILAKSNWDVVTYASTTPSMPTAITWLSTYVTYVGDNKNPHILLTGAGHRFASAYDAKSYPHSDNIPGPIFVVYYSSDSDFPNSVPNVAISALREHSTTWSWMVFLSPVRIVVFRADENGVEIYGPVSRT